MKKLLVILHVYYPDQVGYFVRKLANINGCDWDLVVTSPGMDAESRRILMQLKPDARFLSVENIGYDVWPFIKVIQETDLAAYDYVLKLHTKGSLDGEYINGLNLKGYRWRNLLVDALLKSPRRFWKCLDYFDNNPEVGMIYSYELSMDLRDWRLPENTTMLESEVRRIGMVRDYSGDLFCAGTMFIVRAAALSRIQRLQLDDTMWGAHFASHSTASLAHVYERLMAIMVKDAGYEMRGFMAGRFSAFSVYLHKEVVPVLELLFSIDTDANRRKYVMVLGNKFYLHDDAGKIQD